MILTNSGVLKLMQRIKSYIASQLNTKAPSVHTHSISEIDDLSSLQMGGGGYSKSEVDTLLNGKSDTSHTHTKSDITDFPTLATVATSGSYSDLSNKPTIPTVNNATLTIQKNGTTVKTFTANASSDVTCNITVPTKTSELTNDSCIPLSGTNALSGSIVPNTDNAYNLGDSTYGFASFYTNKIYLKDSTIFKLVDDNYICIGGSTAQANGANLVLNGKNRSTSTGEFKLEARDGTYTRQLIGKPDGTLSWNGDIIPSTDGVYNVGSVTNQFSIIYASGVVNHSVSAELSLGNANGGADIVLCPKEYYDGFFRIRAYNGTTRHTLQGEAGGTLYWSGTVIRPYGDGSTTLGTGTYRFGQIYSTSSTISTSDQRKKQQIKSVDDKLLNAWENVNIVQFKFNDSVEEKGANARLHTGYIAQNIQQACEEKGVNPNDYGLFCFDSWEEQEEKKDKNGEVIEPYRAKGDLYSLRYEEALVVECAYLRKCIKELRAEIEELKSSK